MGKFINYHGHPTVRFESSDRVMEKNMTPSWWFWIFSALLFWMPDVYLRCLEDIWIEDTNYERLNIHLWNEFIRSLNTDWDNSTTPVGNHIAVWILTLTYVHLGNRVTFCERRVLGYPEY